MNILTSLRAQFSSKTLTAFFAITATFVGLYEINIVLPEWFLACSILGVSLKEGCSYLSKRTGA